MEQGSYINTALIPTPSVTKKKKQHSTDGHKDVKVSIQPDDGYGARSIGGDTDETGYGENNKNKAEWLRGLQDYSHGPDSLNPDVRQIPVMSLDASLNTIHGFKKSALKKFLREQIERGIDFLKEKGKIPDDKSSYKDVLLTLENGQKITIDAITDQIAEEALKVLNKEIASASKEAPAEGTPDAEAAPGQAAPDDFDGIMDELDSLAAANQAAIKTGASYHETTLNDVNAPHNGPKPSRFVPPGETRADHKKRTMVEQLSKDEENEVEFHKTQIEPNEESKPYLQDGNGGDNPEQGFAGTPMYNNVFMWSAG